MADGLTVGNVTLMQGGTATVEVEFNNTADSYRAVLLDIALPEGVTIEGDKYGDLPCAKGTRLSENYSVTGNHLENGNYRFGVINTSDDEPIAGESGTLFSFTITAAAEAATGTFPATVSAIKLTDASAVDHAQEGFTFDVTVEENDGRIHFDESQTQLPTYTAGGKADVRMQCTIKAGNWSAIVLPFTLTKEKAEAAFGADVQLAEFSGFEVDYGEDEENVTPLGITINFKTYTMNARKSMTGGKPFLIRTSRDIDSFEADEVTLFDAVTDVAQTDEFDTQGRFTGTLVKGTIPVNGIFLNGNKFWYATEGQPTQAFRAWLELGAVLGQATDFGVKLAFAVDGMATGIDGLGTSTTTAGTTYDLAGRRVSVPRRGVYVVDGKKVVVK